eukprot:TRINITY_DN3582_c1_g1_i7.p1 TRINITY_DN3582_c1_g1~~TRINITY_DN3582_c1_g1_i7.p1  ORF type:complete len:684 (-),score=104.20 TRINITY_DN3582_c1_g1_i7:184-2196(-)
MYQTQGIQSFPSYKRILYIRPGSLWTRSPLLKTQSFHSSRLKLVTYSTNNGATPQTYEEDQQHQENKKNSSVGIEDDNEDAGFLSGMSVKSWQVIKTPPFKRDVMEMIKDCPGTKTWYDLANRTMSLEVLNRAMRKGYVPHKDEMAWPDEPFKSKFLEALTTLELPRFTRRFPRIMDSLLKTTLALIKEFERQMEEENERQQQLMQQQQAQEQTQQTRQSNSSGGMGQSQQQQQQQDQRSDQQEGDPNAEGVNVIQERKKQNKNKDSQGKDGVEEELKIAMESVKKEQQQQELKARMQKEADKISTLIVKKFEKDMKPVVEGLTAVLDTFGDIGDFLNDSNDDIGLQRGRWQRTGWSEMQKLQKQLQDLKELRELVRNLGRGGGKGPLRKAPQQVYSHNYPYGVIRSVSIPEEVTGLQRSGSLSRMLPSEIALLAAGWPRYKLQQDQHGNEEEVILKEGFRPARLLFMARRAERNLMCYERTGWVDDEPARVTGRMEIRPAAEQGPIIVCLDTSGSMAGARETVAKAITLECMRGAYRQKRQCYLYAFSGQQDIQELQLGSDFKSLERLLEFLQYSFGGGTDVDKPLELSIQRLETAEWSLADILVVSDGEFYDPNKQITEKLKELQATKGLEVHGLVLNKELRPAMKNICTHIHMFKAWDVVGAKEWEV